MFTRKFKEEDTIIVFFDFEFYVPFDDRKNKGFKSNPYNDGHFLIGGTFLSYYPLLKNKEIAVKRFWIWDHKNEKDMLSKILDHIKILWQQIEDSEYKQELVVCGIGIGRVDIPYFIGRCHKNNIDSEANLFHFMNRLRIIDLENATILLYKNKNDFLYTKSTGEINQHLLGHSVQRKSGTSVWDYYDDKKFTLIIERNEKEVFDQIDVYKVLQKYIRSKRIRNSYLANTFQEQLNQIKKEADRKIVLDNYLLNNEKSHYVLRDIDFDNKSNFKDHIELKLKIMEIMEAAYNLSKTNPTALTNGNCTPPEGG